MFAYDRVWNTSNHGWPRRVGVDRRAQLGIHAGDGGKLSMEIMSSSDKNVTVCVANGVL